MIKSAYASVLLSTTRRSLRLIGGAHAPLSLHPKPVSQPFGVAVRFYSTEDKTTPSIDLDKVLETEPTQRTPQTAFFIPNMYTHRFLPEEERVKKLSNKELAAEIFKVRDIPLTVDVNHSGKKLIDKNGLPFHKYIQSGFLERDVSEYDLYLDEFKAELHKYKQNYISKLSSSLQGVDIKSLPKDIQDLIPEHMKKSIVDLKLERIEARKSKKLMDEKIANKSKKSKADSVEDMEEGQEDEEPAEEAEEAGDSDKTTLEGGLVASRTNLRLSYKDNYRVPRFHFETLRKDLQMLKLMDNENSAHRQYLIQCNLELKEKHEVILHSVLSKNSMQVKRLEPPKSMAHLRAAPKNNSAFLPLENAGIQVNFTSIGKDYLQNLIKNRDTNQDIMTIIDVRSRVRAFDCRIPGAVNIPLREILKGALKLNNEDFLALYGVPKIPSHHTLIFYADHQQDAVMASALAYLNNGYKNVVVYTGGVADWFDYGFQPLWARYRNVAQKTLNREEWLQHYGINKNHTLQETRKSVMLKRFISERLPEDLGVLRMLNTYAKKRIALESDESSETRLPFVGEIDLHDGVPASLLHELTSAKIEELSVVLNPAHAAVNQAYNYQKYYGPKSQKTQL